MNKEKQTYNPCDDCRYSYSKNNQESGMCKICEFTYFKDRKQRMGENITELHPVDEFVCSECGLIMRDCCRIEIDEDDDDEICYEFAFKYCPRCGAKMKGE